MCFNRPSSPTVFPQPASLSQSPFCQPLPSAEHAVYPAYPFADNVGLNTSGNTTRRRPSDDYGVSS